MKYKITTKGSVLENRELVKKDFDAFWAIEFTQVVETHIFEILGIISDECEGSWLLDCAYGLVEATVTAGYACLQEHGNIAFSLTKGTLVPFVEEDDDFIRVETIKEDV